MQNEKILKVKFTEYGADRHSRYRGFLKLIDDAEECGDVERLRICLGLYAEKIIQRASREDLERFARQILRMFALTDTSDVKIEYSFDETDNVANAPDASAHCERANHVS